MASSTEDIPSHTRFSSNNPFRSRRRTSTVSSLKPAAEAPLPQPQQQPLQHHHHLQQSSPHQGQHEKRPGKRHTPYLHGHNIFSRRRQSAWDAASIASSASSPSAAEMDTAEHQTKRPSRRMTLTTTRPFVHAENVPLPSLPAHFRSKNLSSYDAPSSASFASLAYDSISPPSTAPGSTAASTSHRRATTSSRPTTTGEGGFSARRSRNTRDASEPPPTDAHLIFPISFDDFHNSISIDGRHTIASDTMTNDNTFNIPSGTDLDSPELASTFPIPAAYEPTPAAAHDSSAINATGTTAGNTPSSNHHNKSSFSKNNNNSSSSSNHATATTTTAPSSSNTRKGTNAKTTTNIRTGRNLNVAALSGLTRHDSNASTSTSTSTSRTTNSNNANNSSSLQHTQSHLRLQTSASNLAGSSASPVPSRFTRQGRGTATGTTTGGASSGHARPPRRSIGPGIITSSHPSTYDMGSGDGASKYPVKRRPSLVKRKSGDVARALRGIEHDRSNGGGIGARNDDMPDFLVSGPQPNLRAQKAVSMFPSQQHPPSSSSSSHRHHYHQLQSRNPFIHAMNENIDPSKTTQTTASSSNNKPIDEPLRSPGGNGKHTPTAKRMSMVPPHHTGLGARTISPTDVRKIKRMSTVSEGSSNGNSNANPNSAGGAAAPPTPHLDEFPSHLLSHAVTSPNVSASGYSDYMASVASPSATQGFSSGNNTLGIATATFSNATPTLSTYNLATTPYAYRPRSSASVSMIPRKSATPSRSSSRITPDSSRRNFANGGNSSAANRDSGDSCAGANGGSVAGLGIAYSTPMLRDSNGMYTNGYGNGNGNGSAAGSVGSRTNQAFPSSRLPTPKARGGNDVPVVATGGADGEEVPPVPAIPKAYGSPRPSGEQQYASNSIGTAVTGYDYTPTSSSRKASLPFDMLAGKLSTPVQSSLPFTPTSKTKSTSDYDYGDETPTSASSAAAAAAAAAMNHRTRSLHTDYKASQSPLPRNKLQPLKLPPLNLAPLSGSIARHIDALKVKSGNRDLAPEHLPMTPSPPKHHPRTPTTPMTASKATFFMNKEVEPEMPRTARIRRSTSTRFGAPLTREISAGSNDGVSITNTECDDGGGGGRDDDNGYDDCARQIDSSVPDVPEIPDTLSGSSGTGPSYSPALTAGEKGTTTPSASSSLPRPPAVGGYNARANASTAKLTGPRPFSHHQSNLTKPRTADGGSSTNNGSESITPKASKHESAPAPTKSGPSVTFSGKPPAIASAPRGSPAAKPPSLHIRRRSAGGALALATGRGSGGSNGSTVPVRAPSMGNPPPLTADNNNGSLGGVSPDSRTSGPVHQLTHRSSPAGTRLRAGGAGTRSVSTGGKLRPVDHTIDQEDLAAEEEMRRLGHKRRDFEAQARSLDELRRRAGPKERVTPAQALRYADLNIFEKGEIIDFKEVYFTGTDKAKKHVGDLHASAANFGYDDDRGDYNIVLGDHLAYRYEVIDVLGKGSFGQVVRCIDHKTGGLVAVKIIRNKKRFHQQALVEVNLLSKLKEWDAQKRHSVVNFTQSFYFRGHLCISTELLGMNLYELIKAHDFKGFSLRIIRRFTKQILSTLVLLHHHKVIHCDLKPENILLAHPLRTEIKTIDFGSSCFENEKVYTYIQSRFYRSPEVILGMSYGMPIDMWSLGCIMAELYTGYPIFPGENEQEQLACIMEIFGPPERHLIEKSSRRKLFFDSSGKPRTMVSSKGRRRRPSSKELRSALKCDDEPFLDFVARCLRWDPHRRLNPIDALSHEFITGVKATPRARHYSSSNSIKRSLTARPLPEPPGASKAPTGSVRSVNKHANLSSPSKFSRRPSGVNANLTTTGSSSRRLTAAASSGNLAGSSLPRVAPRSVSGKPDLAGATATTGLTS